MKRASAWLAALAFAGAVHAADEDRDLDLIPRTAPGAPQQAPTRDHDAGNRRLYVENAFMLASRRDDLLVPAPSPLPPRWQERLFADARAQWALGPNALLAYSGRLNLGAGEDSGSHGRGNAAHDWREGYLTLQPRPRDYLDIGRVNVKSGVALGFNPTDFFKARAVVDPLTADPRTLREDRLGTLMIRGQRVGDGGSLSAAYAPKVADPPPPGAQPGRGLRTLFDRTNASDRWLVKASAPLGAGMDPEVLLHHEDGRWKAGLNVAQAVGQSAVVYLEWAGGRRRGIVDEALAFARRTGTIPPSAPDVIDQGGDERFRTQLALGASYTTEAKLTFNVEYHYNGAGLSRRDWGRWFAAGESAPAASPVTRTLWLVRSYAAERQEPLQRHAVFVRADWVDFLVPRLVLTGFVLADAGDGSALLQLQADYAHSDTWSLGVLASGTTGGRRSSFGSLPQAASILFRATRYF